MYTRKSQCSCLGKWMRGWHIRISLEACGFEDTDSSAWMNVGPTSQQQHPRMHNLVPDTIMWHNHDD